MNKELTIQKIDSILTALYEEKKFNGSILLGKNGEILYNKAFGLSDFRTAEILDTNSQFRIGSITGQFTAMAVMILQERGKLDYDDTAQDYLINFPYSDITIRHLLTQTSGLPDHDYSWQRYKEERPAGIEFPQNGDLLD